MVKAQKVIRKTSSLEEEEKSVVSNPHTKWSELLIRMKNIRQYSKSPRK